MAEYKLSYLMSEKNFIDIPNTGSDSHTLINDTDKDVPMVITMNAGNSGTYYSGSAWFPNSSAWNLESDWTGNAQGTQYQTFYMKSMSYTSGYSSGTTINILKDDVYIATCYGGSGAFTTYRDIKRYRNERYYRSAAVRDNSGNIKGYNTWYDYKNNVDLGTTREYVNSGAGTTPQQEFKVIILHAGSTLKINFSYAYGSYKGAASISWTDKTIAFGDHIDRKE